MNYSYFRIVSMNMKQKAIFLDRDGTINDDSKPIFIKGIGNTSGYVHHIDQWVLLPEVTKALQQLSKTDYKLIIVTNQSSVARGICTEIQITKLHDQVRKDFKKNNIRIDGIYICPHLENGTVKQFAINCNCRKPKPGMLLQASADHNISLEESYMIGDKDSDILCGQAAGCKTILIQGFHKTKSSPSWKAENLLQASAIIMRKTKWH